MKIQKLETFSNRSIAFVRVTTDEGAQGWGQTSTFNADITAQVFHRQVAPHALGKDPDTLDALLEKILENEYKFPGTYVCRALTGLDTAIWDLRGRLAGKSVCALLGGVPRTFPVYGSSMSRQITPRDEAARLQRLMDEKGYRAFKVRIGSVCGHDQDQWPGRTEELIPTVRKAIGDQTALLADGNSCYSAPKAIEVGRMLEQYNLGHFEEPCPYWELEWTRDVAAALSIPVAGGEQDYDLCQWRRMIEMDAVDIVQPDIGYIGGLSRALRVAEMAQAAGKICVPHSANMAMVVIFSLHMMGAIPNAGPNVEWTIEQDDWTRDLFLPMPEVRDGKVHIPEGPGWGVEVNPAWLNRADYAVSELPGG